MNIVCDGILRELRSTPGYKVPYGSLFEYVSAGNYFAELIEWTGWAIAANTWTT